MKYEHDYLALLQDILLNGEDRNDRTGVGTRAVFDRTLRIDLQAGFPLLTTKKVPWKTMVTELLWFIEGSGDERRLAELLHGTRDPSKRTIWTDNAEASYWKPKARYEGDLGRVYGVQWRSWRTFKPLIDRGDDNQVSVLPLYEEGPVVDQLADLIHRIKTNPTDRRLLITAWNPGELSQMALPPCHLMAQFYVSNSRRLSCKMYQRSVDTVLGLPVNIASYALFTHLVARCTGLDVGHLTMDLGDTHIYSDHMDGVKEQLLRLPASSPPQLLLKGTNTDIDSFTMEDIVIENYAPAPAIKFKMAV